ncbi:hypothetical protein PsYK624_110020 [Phanerochaete sordida]|uniref:Tc1-like transposase DDE domain-containing protein n=1 Tax=Phanerochaete sordida TaxID=48140 RepID=A0A9P3LI56_9APHY|nr:hypothetical protein PsYK624_110020 [Phanerochaete sordida]
MKQFLWMYISHDSITWIRASVETAKSRKKSGTHTATKLRQWTRAFIEDADDLPYHDYGWWQESLLHKGELAQRLFEHLQSVGKYVTAMDVVRYMGRPEIKEEFGLTKTISLATAKRWMHLMEYRWGKTPKGQYVDGHEREDVVEDRQTVFLPSMEAIEGRLREWSDDGEQLPGPIKGKPVMVWYHDEVTFYRNDRQELHWVHKNDTPVPKPKGEGTSIMISDLISAEVGWLRSPDGQESARVVFRAGKNREGYFQSEDILSQTAQVIDLLKAHYPDHDHVLVFDHAPTHMKRRDTSVTAYKMTKSPSKVFGVDVNKPGADGRPVYDSEGKLVKMRVRMGDAKFSDGTTQPLYFPDDHPTHPGQFKGMAQILRERGLTKEAELPAQCPDFHCPGPKATDPVKCCCRRVLFNQPDFAEGETLLETLCRSHGIEIIYLPKFHCELNPIERCWCHAKRVYRQNPNITTTDDEMERNVIAALESVSLLSMRRFCNTALRYMDGYRQGLNGAQSSYAARVYSSHRRYPEGIAAEMERKMRR